MAENCEPLSKKTIIQNLQSAGINKGDLIFVHSDMMAIWSSPMPPQQLVPFYLECLLEAIGREGTLAVPAYFYEYARSGLPYDTKSSPVSKPLGVFAVHIAALPQAHRSLCPISAVGAIGKDAEWICGGETAISFGADSPWERMMEAGGKMVFLGAPIQAMTFVHFVEHRAGVPHLYNKLYPTSISRNGQAVDLTVVAQVPYLAYDISYNLDRFEADMKAAGIVAEAEAGSGKIKVVEFRKAYALLLQKLQKELFYLLKSPPKFREGEIPLDGNTGPRPKEND